MDLMVMAFGLGVVFGYMMAYLIAGITEQLERRRTRQRRIFAHCPHGQHWAKCQICKD